MSTSLDALIPELQPYARELIRLAGLAGLQPRVSSTMRTSAEQTRLYERFLRGLSDYPVAAPGTSAHEYGEAFDVVVTPYEDLSLLGDQWQLWGGTWGAAADPIHFELPGSTQRHRTAARAVVQAATAAGAYPTLWDWFQWGASATSLAGLLLELGYIASSEQEAEKIARALHLDPHGRVF